MTTRPDDARHLTGLDGFGVAVEPTRFADVTAERIAVIAAAVAADLVVPLPARTEEQIPRPAERATPARKHRGKKRRATQRATARFVVVAAPAVPWPVLLVALVVHALDGSHASGFPGLGGIFLEYWLIRSARRLYAEGRERSG